MKFDKLAALAALLGAIGTLTLTSGCSGGSDAEDTAAEGTPDVTAEKEEYYSTYKRVPPELKLRLDKGEITQAEFDAEMEQIPLFFQTKTLADLPANLNWRDGSDLEEIGDPDAEKGGTLRGWLQDFPRTLRPVGPDANGSFRPYIVDDAFVKLAPRHPNDTSVTDEGFKHYPGLADRWAVDKENRTVYFHLDPDARWSDGEPVTMDDMFFLFFFNQSPYIVAPWYNNYYTEKFSNITRYDDHTGSIQVAELRPDLDFMVLDLYALPEHFYTELGTDYVQRYQWRFQPTTAAYVIHADDVNKGRSITLTRQQDWWAKDKPFWRYRFNYDKIRLEVIRDPAKAFEVFKDGKLDVAPASPMNQSEYWYDKLPDSDPLVANGYIDKVIFYNDIPRPTYGIWINQLNPLLAQKDIRIGIAYASNWQKVIENYFRGDAARINTTAPGYGYMEIEDIKARSFDIEQALAHFAKAGFTQRGPDGILVNDQGQRLSFTLTTGYRHLQDILSILQQEARKAGLELNLEILESTAGWKKVQEKKHELAFTAFGVAPEMYPRYWETYHSINAYKPTAFLPNGDINPDREIRTQTNNLLMLADPQMDAWIEAYDTSDSIEEMHELASKMEQWMHDEAVWIPGYYLPFYRVGKWRWVRFPDDFNVKISQYHFEHYLSWIDSEMKQETLDALNSGKTFDSEVEVYDQYKHEE